RGNAGCAVVAAGGDGAGTAIGHLDVATFEVGDRVDAGGEAVDRRRTDVATVVDPDATRAAVVGVYAGRVRAGRRDGAAVVHVHPAIATGRIDAIGVAIHGRTPRFRVRRCVGRCARADVARVGHVCDVVTLGLDARTPGVAVDSDRTCVGDVGDRTGGEHAVGQAGAGGRGDGAAVGHARHRTRCIGVHADHVGGDGVGTVITLVDARTGRDRTDVAAVVHGDVTAGTRAHDHATRIAVAVAGGDVATVCDQRVAAIGLHHGAIGQLRIARAGGVAGAGVVDCGAAVVVGVGKRTHRQQVAAVAGDRAFRGVLDGDVAVVRPGNRAIRILAVAGECPGVVHGGIAVTRLREHTEAVLAIGRDRAAVVDHGVALRRVGPHTEGVLARRGVDVALVLHRGAREAAGVDAGGGAKAGIDRDRAAVGHSGIAVLRVRDEAVSGQPAI